MKRNEKQLKIADSRNEVAANSLENDNRLNQKKRTAVKKVVGKRVMLDKE